MIRKNTDQPTSRSPPGHGIAEALGIAGQPRDQVTDRGLVIKRKGQFLQALESGAADVAAKPHFHLAAQADEQVDAECEHDDQPDVEQDEGQDARQIAGGGEAVDRLPFQQGKDDLDHRDERRCDDDPDNMPVIGLCEAEELLPRPHVEFFGIDVLFLELHISFLPHAANAV